MITWEPVVDGGDLVMSGHVTWFGGADDPDDNGQTASGINTKYHPEVLGCALPIPVSNGIHVKATAGTPLPPLPYHSTLVQFTCGKRTLTVPLIDVGPELSLNRPADLTQAAFLYLGGNKNVGIIVADIRILGAKRYLIA